MNTNWPLMVSVTINLAFAGALGISYFHGDRPATASSSAPAASNAPVSASAREQPRSHALRWIDLESADLATYSENLRATGCPEEIIRAIVAPEITSMFEQKRQQVQAKFTGSNDPGFTAAVASLERERQALTARLLPPPSTPSKQDASAHSESSSPVSSSTGNSQGTTGTEQRTEGGSGLIGFAAVGRNASSSAANANPPPPSRIPVPAALQDPPPGAELSPSQTAQLNTLRQNFVDAVGGPNQDPTDPAYLQRWLQATTASDQQFKTYFGVQAFLQLQLNNRLKENSGGQ